MLEGRKWDCGVWQRCDQRDVLSDNADGAIVTRSTNLADSVDRG